MCLAPDADDSGRRAPRTCAPAAAASPVQLVHPRAWTRPSAADIATAFSAQSAGPIARRRMRPCTVTRTGEAAWPAIAHVLSTPAHGAPTAGAPNSSRSPLTSYPVTQLSSFNEGHHGFATRTIHAASRAETGAVVSPIFKPLRISRSRWHTQDHTRTANPTRQRLETRWPTSGGRARPCS
jgi:hypothetical protein